MVLVLLVLTAGPGTWQGLNSPSKDVSAAF